MSIQYRAAVPSDYANLTALWSVVFNEPQEAVALFFNRNLSLHAYMAQRNGAPVAAVYLTDATLNGEPAHYLCGAATLPAFRGRGIMSRLIAFALNDARSRGDCYSLLYPANEGLYRFYERLGYHANCGTSALRLSRAAMEADAAAPLATVAAPDYEAMQRACFHDNFLLQNNNFMRFAIDYYRFYGTQVLSTSRCLALWEEENETATVFYSIYYDFKELKYLLLQHSGAPEFVFLGKNGEPLPHGGMLKALHDSGPLPRPYIGITLQ